MSSFRYSLLATFVLLNNVVLAQNQACYYPDKLTVSDDTPCDGNAEVSACCPSDSYCMSNGLCFKSGIVSRGSCTDQDWSSGECTSYCRTSKYWKIMYSEMVY